MHKSMKNALSTPVAIIIAGVFISIAVLYSQGDLPFIGNKTVKTENTVEGATGQKAETDGEYSKFINLATSLQLDKDKFKACIEKRDDAEIKKDLGDAQAAGANGTPAFFIGKKINDTEVEGIRIFGAYPFDTFKEIIDAYLANDNVKILAAANQSLKDAGQPEVKNLSEAVGKVSVDDDPVKGNKDAGVYIVEFSDYECPFCQRHFKTTYPSIKSQYIDSDKVALVFRDLPLPFHEPIATSAAVAANCARVQGGDEAYFRYNNAYYSSTQSNGKGLP